MAGEVGFECVCVFFRMCALLHLISSALQDGRWVMKALTLRTVFSVGRCFSVTARLRPFARMVVLLVVSDDWLDMLMTMVFIQFRCG